MKILIKNGTIINANKSAQLDVLIVNNKIIQVATNIESHEDYKIIDAQGKSVIPGGIDPHVHMQLPTPAGPSSDSFLTGSKAALLGGTTTLIDFVTPSRGESMIDALEKRTIEAKKSLTNYSFHVSPVEWRDTTKSEIDSCIKQGFNSFKVYLAYKNVVGLNESQFQNVLKAVSKAGGIVTAHCENGDKIDKLRNKYASEGKISPKYHSLSRPAEYEAEAVKMAIELADKANCPLYIVHVSSQLSLELIREAQKKGQKVFAETCPHYLLLDDSKYIGEFNKTAPYVLSPPLRKEADQDALWEAIKDFTVQTIGTDHCPFNLSQKSAGKDDFRKIPNGAGGVEHRLELLFTYGILEKKINLEKWVDITSTQAAKIFGLYPNKGVIAKGSDADVTIWNPKTKKTISVNNHHQNCDSNIFEGFKVKGHAETVILNGEIVVENGELNNNISTGELLLR